MFRSRMLPYILLGIFLAAPTGSWADDKVTRIYTLKHADVTNIERAINIVVRDLSKTRVVGGQGKRLVVSDTPEQQDQIAQMLPVLDQPISETDPERIQMRMLMNAAQYMRAQKIAMKAAAAPAAGRSAAAPASTGMAQSYDKFKAATPYKSIYASDDAKLTSGPRYLDEPLAISLGGLRLAGIYKDSKGTRIALMSYDGTNYTAQDGGLYQAHHVRVKNVVTKVLKDQVLVTGQDNITHVIKFISAS